MDYKSILFGFDITNVEQLVISTLVMKKILLVVLIFCLFKADVIAQQKKIMYLDSVIFSDLTLGVYNGTSIFAFKPSQKSKKIVYVLIKALVLKYSPNAILGNKYTIQLKKYSKKDFKLEFPDYYKQFKDKKIYFSTVFKLAE
jgi:hypothetical protein